METQIQKLTQEIITTHEQEKSLHAVWFADWLHNNWLIPIGTDNYWKIDIDNSEYQKTLNVPEPNLFRSEELWELFNDGKGEC